MRFSIIVFLCLSLQPFKKIFPFVIPPVNVTLLCSNSIDVHLKLHRCCQIQHQKHNPYYLNRLNRYYPIRSNLDIILSNCNPHVFCRKHNKTHMSICRSYGNIHGFSPPRTYIQGIVCTLHPGRILKTFCLIQVSSLTPGSVHMFCHCEPRSCILGSSFLHT